MASIEKIVPPPVAPTYVLTLTEAEAHTILALVAQVEGDPERSPGKHSQAVYEAFRTRDNPYPFEGVIEFDLLDPENFTFKDYPETKEGS